jgi:pimeloyl-ACP methyl ester carboxylesterase
MLRIEDRVVNGVRSAVQDSGPRDRSEAVVFVHGNPGPMDDWERLMLPVAEFARVVAMDMPGYGRADRPRDFDYTVEGYATHLGGLLEQLGVKRAHLVLHDFGGPWGLAWASHHLDAQAGVTLINTGVLVGYRWHKYARVWQVPVLGELAQLPTSATLYSAAVNADNPRPLPREFVDRVIRYMDWGHKRAVLRLYRATRDVDGQSRAVAQRMGTVDRPACVVWGAGDPYLPLPFAERQREWFPRAEVHALEGLGHWPFIDDPNAVHDIVVPFLRRHVTPA